MRNLDRPRSLVNFDRVFLATLVAFVLLAFIRGLVDHSSEYLSFVLIYTLVAAVPWLAILLPVWFFVSRRGSRMARWLLVALTLVVVGQLASSLAAWWEYGPVWALAVIGEVLMLVVAVAFLFRRDAAEWFRAGLDTSVFE